MKKLKKFLIYTLIGFILFAGFAFLYFDQPKIFRYFDNKLKDYMFLLRGKIATSNTVVIVDIDEKSLYKLGQWPWSRNVVAKIIQNLTDAGAAAIGLDIVFAEKDRTSPSLIVKKLHIPMKNAPDYDNILVNTVINSPTILGYEFQLEKHNFLKQGEIDIPAVIIEKHKPKGMNPYINAKGVILNFKKLQENAYSSGFFNSIPDDDGIIRKTPLLIKYHNQIYPSLSLELLRALIGSQTVIVNYSELGVMNLQIGKLQIPTDRFGRFVINFRGPKRDFKYLSAFDIYKNDFNKSLIKNKIVLMGTTAAGLFDLRATPFDAVFPGVEVHANIIDNIIEGDFLKYPYWIDTANLIILFVSIFLTIYIIVYLPSYLLLAAFLIILNGYFFEFYNLFIKKGIVINMFLPLLAIIVSTLIVIFLEYFFKTRQEQLIKHKFASKVSKEVMEDILNNSNEDTFRAKISEVTIFFSDIRNFTKISESLKDAKLIIEFLNEYMEPMSKIIMNNHGTIDKYIGDAIMAYWNAPNKVKNHPQKAVEASLEQLYKLKEINDKYKTDPKFAPLVEMSNKYNMPILDIGIGLNTGEAVVGEMGSLERSDYTIIGDSVNLASRLESLCKHYNSRLNISHFLKERIDEEKFIFRFLDLVTVKGKNEPVEIWQIIDYNSDNLQLVDVSKEELLKELEIYNKGIQHYQNREFEKALEIFERLENNENKTNKNIYKIYIERCKFYIDNPKAEFKKVFEFTTKG